MAITKDLCQRVKQETGSVAKRPAGVNPVYDQYQASMSVMQCVCNAVCKKICSELQAGEARLVEVQVF